MKIHFLFCAAIFAIGSSALANPQWQLTKRYALDENITCPIVVEISHRGPTDVELWAINTNSVYTVLEFSSINKGTVCNKLENRQRSTIGYYCANTTFDGSIYEKSACEDSGYAGFTGFLASECNPIEKPDRNFSLIVEKNKIRFTISTGDRNWHSCEYAPRVVTGS